MTPRHRLDARRHRPLFQGIASSPAGSGLGARGTTSMPVGVELETAVIASMPDGTGVPTGKSSRCLPASASVDRGTASRPAGTEPFPGASFRGPPTQSPAPWKPRRCPAAEDSRLAETARCPAASAFFPRNRLDARRHPCRSRNRCLNARWQPRGFRGRPPSHRRPPHRFTLAHRVLGHQFLAPSSLYLLDEATNGPEKKSPEETLAHCLRASEGAHCATRHSWNSSSGQIYIAPARCSIHIRRMEAKGQFPTFCRRLWSDGLDGAFGQG